MFFNLKFELRFTILNGWVFGACPYPMLKSCFKTKYPQTTEYHMFYILF